MAGQSSALAQGINISDHHSDCIAACNNSNDTEQIIVDVDGLSLTLNLIPNFVASESTFAINGKLETENSWFRPQTYQGSVDDDPDSWVRVIKNQKGLFLGQVQAFGKLYEISPSADKTKNYCA